MKIVSLISLFLVVAQGHATNETSNYRKPRIVNGEDVKPGKRPYQVSLQYAGKPGSHFCGGSIVNNFWVVTAAHCIYDKLNIPLVVIAGTIDLSQPFSTHRVERKIKHEFFVPKVAIKDGDGDYIGSISNPNDIALLKVVEPFVFSKREIHPVNLASSNYNIYGGSPVFVSGWGQTAYTRDSRILKKVQVFITPFDKCYSNMGSIDTKILNSQICTESGGWFIKADCKGDSGGPLTDENNILVGIVSWGVKVPNCDNRAHPHVFTRISYYRKWIDGYINRTQTIIVPGI